ncbi:MAG: GAP family protein [Mycolicibacterium sp.]|nr:GAP family protein [Mycolicibacterium sp.]
MAMDPVRIGIAALLISRPRPMLNLFVFWLGGMAAGIAAASIVLLFLRNFALSVLRVVVSAISSPIVAHIQLAVGVLAVIVAARIWARERVPVPVTGGEGSVLVRRPKTTGSNLLSIRGQLEGGSLVVVFVAGLALATPPVEYLAAIIAILASGGTAAAQVGAALMFTLVAFTVVEVPLISYLAAPAKTLAIVQRLNHWIIARRRAIPAVLVGAIGFVLLATSMGKV